MSLLTNAEELIKGLTQEARDANPLQFFENLFRLEMHNAAAIIAAAEQDTKVIFERHYGALYQMVHRCSLEISAHRELEHYIATSFATDSKLHDDKLQEYLNKIAQMRIEGNKMDQPSPPEMEVEPTTPVPTEEEINHAMSTEIVVLNTDAGSALTSTELPALTTDQESALNTSAVTEVATQQ